MKVPLAWLKEYVDAGAPPEEVGRRLVMAGAGVEGIEGDVLDLEITANRADLLSMIGVAREVGGIFGKPATVPDLAFPESDEAVSGACTVEVAAPDLCPRYVARVVRGVRIGPSPSWMAERLEAAGIRPVNNVVDVTNFVLLEWGQPLHAFDAGALGGAKIVVRRASAGEKIVAIDGKTYDLSPEMLVIADATRPVAIAGVMGGKESEIGAGSKDVLIESAQFDPVSVRRTSRRLGLSSESSYRFERGVDFENVDRASRRAVQLLVQIAGGTALKGVVDVKVAPPPAAVARVRPARVAKVLGMEVSPARVREILGGLGCAVAGTDEALDVTSPPGRRDLHLEVDYIEEVARIEGYDKIPCDTGFGLRVAEDNAEDLVREEARTALTGLGAFEVLTWSFAEAATPNRVNYWTDGAPIPLRDPDGKVDRTLRESLAPGLLTVLRTNEAYREELCPIFEMARIYRKTGEGYGEKSILGIAAPGDPLGVKGLVETALGRLGVEFEIVPAPMGFLQPGRSAEIRSGGQAIGWLGAPAEALQGPLAEVGVAEIDFEAVVAGARLTSPYRDFNRQPPVSRDLSVLLDEGTAWKDVEAAVRGAAPATLESVRFLSEYRGKQVEKGRKAVAFTMVFRAPDRTLTGEEGEAAVKSVMGELERALGARLR